MKVTGNDDIFTFVLLVYLRGLSCNGGEIRVYGLFRYSEKAQGGHVGSCQHENKSLVSRGKERVRDMKASERRVRGREEKVYGSDEGPQVGCRREKTITKRR